MRTNFCCGALKSALLCCGFLFVLIPSLSAQEPPTPTAPSPVSADSANDLRVLSATILELKSQLNSMRSQLDELRQEQERSRQETLELRKRLEILQPRDTTAENALSSYGAPPQ